MVLRLSAGRNTILESTSRQVEQACHDTARHAGRRHSSRRCVMVAIAMTREMGTLGKDVAQGIADSLGLKVIHSELVEHDLATRLGVQESAVHRYLEGG